MLRFQIFIFVNFMIYYMFLFPENDVLFYIKLLCDNYLSDYLISRLLWFHHLPQHRASNHGLIKIIITNYNLLIITVVQ